MAKKKNEKLVGRSKMKTSWDNRLFEIINGAILIVLFLLITYPLWFVVIASISDAQALANGEVIFWPKGFSLEAYKRVFENPDVWLGYLNTIFYTVFGTVANVIVTLMVGYATSRRDLPGRNIIITLFVITMYFSGGLIPSYLNVKSMGLVDTRTILIVNGLVTGSQVIVCRTFFQNSVPWELQEAGLVDGASDFALFRKIVLPLAKPIISVMAINYGVSHWNAYFGAMIYLKDRSKFPLQLFLREILIQGSEEALNAVTGQEAIEALTRELNVASQMKYALIIVASVPILMLYPKFEKYFEKGVMIGGVKG